MDHLLQLRSAPLSRRTFVAAVSATPLFFSLRVPQEEPRIVDPPGALGEPLRARWLAAKEALEAKKTTIDELLADPAWSELRPYTEYRELIRDHAHARKVCLVPRNEPGERLFVAGRVLDENGAPRDKVLMYAYQTSSKGWYSDKAPHIGGNSGDFKHARLFGYCRTDAEGRFELDTIRPAGYPRSELPQHIHYTLDAEDESEGGGELWFDDDPRLTKELRAEAKARGCTIVVPARDANGIWRCEAALLLPKSKR